MTKRKTRTQQVSRKGSSSVSVPERNEKGAKSRVRLITALLITLAIAGYALKLYLNASKMADIRIGDCLIKAEIADTPKTREKGLSGRKHLKADHGMFFVFDFVRKQGFWMKDTNIPLSIAFISPDGTILQIEQMKPFDLDRVVSNSPARYALEVNQGFFQENDITVGMRVDLTNVLKKEDNG